MTLALLLASGCGDNAFRYNQARPASVDVTVEVPADAAAAPFDVPRFLRVPPGFGVRVVARIAGARFLAETPGGELLVSVPGKGEIVRVAGTGSVTLASGMNLPHDMVFVERGGIEYLYISEHDRVSRVAWDEDAAALGTLEPVVSDLPSASLPELMGNYGHGLKNIAASADTLFVSIASASNADPSDALADPVRGSVYVYDLDGGGGRLYARGIRNAEGLALHPRTSELWVAINHRDNLRYPLMDGRFPYGELVWEYINDNPPEPFTRVRDGANYGWPYCNPTADGGIMNMPYVPDYDNNADQNVLDCASLDRIDVGLPAHSAPLGMSFWSGATVPRGYRDGAVIGMHGCWNCSVPRGYKVAFLELRADNTFNAPLDLVTGFLSDPMDKNTVWGRPVDVIANRAGNLYISDDMAGAVYELYRTVEDAD